jgi:hypothetical protein
MDTVTAAQKFMRGEAFKRASDRRDAQRDHVMRLIFSKFGFGSVVAKHIGLTPQAVAAWNQVPIKYVWQVSELIDMPPERIRPDIFGKRK